MSKEQTISGLHLAKLMSGEFVVGRIMGMNLINVFIVRFNADSMTGSIQTSLSPYMAPLDHSLSHMISLDKVITITTPSAELTQKYIAAVTQMMAKMNEPTPSNIEKIDLEDTATEMKKAKISDIQGDKNDRPHAVPEHNNIPETETSEK